MATVPDVNAAADVLEDDNENSGALVRRASEAVEIGGVGGADDGSSLRLPWLKIAHGVGGLAENFHPGDLVLNEEACLVEKKVPIQIVVVKTTKYWKEYLNNDAFLAGIKPKKFLSKDECHAAGGTTEWVNAPVKKAPTYAEAVDLSILIRKPKDLICGYFGMPWTEGEGDKAVTHEYAPAMISFDKKAAKNVLPVLEMAAKFSLANRMVDGIKIGTLGAVFDLWTDAEKFKNKSGVETTVFRPKLKLHSHNSDAFVRYILSFFPKNAKAAETTEDGAVQD